MRILNVRNLDPGDLADVVAFCRRRLAEGRGAFLIAMNPIKVVAARSRPDFQKLIDSADRVFPDAWGMGWAARMLHGRDIPLSPGWRVMYALLESAAAENRRVYLLGTTDEILDEAVGRLREKHPALFVAGTHNGFFTPAEAPAVLAAVAAARPDYVFVAMGEYRQEVVIAKLREILPGAVCLGVGGSVDLIAGRQPMPPEWMRRRHLEWLFRIVRQPFRAPRFKALPIFVLLVLRERLGRMFGEQEDGR